MKTKKYIRHIVLSAAIAGSGALSAQENTSTVPSYIVGRTTIERTYNGSRYVSQYTDYDGLGRPNKKYVEGASPEKINGTDKNKDLVEFMFYDCMGRDSVTYLPYAAEGAYPIAQGVSEQPRFYQGYLNRTGNNYTYTSKKYDTSPYGLVVEESAPGEYHHADSYSGHPIHRNMRLNETADSIKRFVFIEGSIIRFDGWYDPGQLAVEEEWFDRSDHITLWNRTYKDTRGRTVATTTLATGESRRIEYHIYEGFYNFPKCTLPTNIESDYFPTPGSEQVWETFRNYIRYFEHDLQGNTIREYNPGQEVRLYVYDKQNRPVLSQDGEHRKNNQWLYTHYDDFGRTYRILLVTSQADESTIRTVCKTYSNANLDYKIRELSTTQVLLTENQYSGYDNCHIVPLPSRPRPTTEILSEDQPQSQAITDQLILGLHQYHTFTMPTHLSFQTIPNVCYIGRTDMTGTKIYEKVAVLPDILTDTTAYIERAYYYDDYGRVAQTVVHNHLGGITRISNKYDFSGNILETVESRQTAAGQTPDLKRTCNIFDDFGRVLSECTTLNDSDEALVRYDYDALGRCSHMIYGDSVLVTGYSYDINGNISRQSGDLFSMEVHTDKALTPEIHANYNGMPCYWRWSQSGIGEINTYTFKYHPYGELSRVEQYVGPPRNPRFVERDITYDFGGNILSLQRTGNSGELLADLSYTYDGYRLTSLSDAISATERQFSYNANGNMTFDSENGWNYQYNVLNLSERVTDSDDRTVVSYSYLADGTKLQALDGDENGLSYLGSFTYRTTGGVRELEGTSFGGGRILKTSEGYEIRYYLRDYMGNVRIVTDSEGGVLESNAYYPYGGRWELASAPRTDNRYLFNGKESQEFVNMPMLDFGARMYDPRIGRWFCADPAMQFANPYLFCGNNPVCYIDKDGRFIEWIILGCAIFGSYMGGAAANDNWAPWKWDWSSGNTWGGILGGAIQGGISGATLAYGISAITGPFGTGTFTLTGKMLRWGSLGFSAAKTAVTSVSLINDFDNGMNIIRGNYLYEGNGFFGKVWEGFSRATWERGQQQAGYLFAQGMNGFKKGIEVEYFHGATLVNDADSGDYKGLTLGSMISGWGFSGTNDPMVYHEYGHTIQSRKLGPIYGLFMAPASGIDLWVNGSAAHNSFSVEKFANSLARTYFGMTIWDSIVGNNNPKYPTY